MLLFSYHNGIPAPLPLPLQGASLESLFDLGYSGTGFSEALMGSTSYQKARAAAATSLQTNVDCTELIAFLADARTGRPHIAGINACFASIDNELDLTEEDKAELYQLVQNFGLGSFLVVPNYDSPSDSTEGDGGDE
jgi:hypothetical protein